MRNPQVNCTSKSCYYNNNGKCIRSGIHANKKSCHCYVEEKKVFKVEYGED